MAFVDTMLDESDADFVIVDNHHMPGGHWNDAYPFVRLHQPSSFYGVASTELGANRIDESGSNQGFYELASGAEVSAYFDNVMRERFLPTGRVRYFPMSEVVDETRCRSLVSNDEFAVNVRQKIVDGTFFNTSVPSTHERKFAVDDAVTCIAPNDLPRRAPDFDRFSILGGGKTAMDVGVWLLEAGADASSIQWLRPRESWLINRETTQPGTRFMKQSAEAFAAQLEALIAANSVDELFERFESAGVMLRIDPSATPRMFHYATISRGEVDLLRRIDDVVRERHVARLSSDEMQFADGDALRSAPNTLYIDCTATAVQFVGARTMPVFAGNRITLQALLAPLVTTSAAVTAFVEAHVDSEEEKNRLCTPVDLADTPAEWMRSFLGNMMNRRQWMQDPALRDWFARCRLNPARPMPGDSPPDDPELAAISEAIGRDTPQAMAAVQALMARD